MKDHNYFVYILTNKIKTVLYIGVTNDLVIRLFQHKKDSFNAKKQLLVSIIVLILFTMKGLKILIKQ